MNYKEMDFSPNAKIVLKSDMLLVNYFLKVKGNRIDLAFAKFKRYKNNQNELINGITKEIIEDLESVNEALRYLQPLIKNNII
ncbi:hypothetical protein [Spiroplasma culicicola]|uniref:Uncharacterized protein n=1 Tax=Spiroplasma culicicola AES-1 TaxID=1276246 RepID=W6A6T6_9MOLU|nr:hypothetical protein [Spiroplasma culicicola]AHI52828.1 hypothetical protein SCULI_v1c04870 [Spiroplasma culicicola AES-1]